MKYNGIAFDIDDTLCDTARTCMEVMNQFFTVQVPFDTDVFLQRYNQPGHVPEWQTPEAQQKIEELLSTNSFLLSLPPIKEAQENIAAVHQLLPISLYITSRIHDHKKVTETWLTNHGFPPAPVITRDPAVTEVDWKITLLTEKYPDIFALVDNEIKTMGHTKFKGHLFEIKRTMWQELKSFLEKNKANHFFEQ